jgi:hypothetical protein
MSWSTKILVLYLGFVALILTLVFTCFGHKTELEYKDYYAREINFQQQLNAQQNAADLPVPITYTLQRGNITLSFPPELLTGISGAIKLLRPSDASKDVNVTVHPDEAGHQVITGLQKGVYKMRVRVEQNGNRYFKEAVLNIR